MKNSIKKIIHNLRFARPNWYKKYHSRGYSDVLHWTVFIVSSVVIMAEFFNLVLQAVQVAPAKNAEASTTTLTQTVNSGALTLSTNPNATLSTVTVNGSSSQTSTGDLGTNTVTDNRGSGVGWSLTDTATNFIAINVPVKTAGNNNTLSSGGTYTSATEGTYTITINGAGSAGTATFTVSGLESQGTTITGSSVAIGTRGVTITFGAASYAINDQWTVRVDTIPVTTLVQTPSSLTTISGSSTGVAVGSGHTFSGTSDIATIMSASSTNGMGSYSNNPALSLTVPASTFANIYTATITETVQ